MHSEREKVKRRGKSSPGRWRHLLHGKPYALKGQIGHVRRNAASGPLVITDVTGRLLEPVREGRPR
jgi:hypothetical protein